MAFLRFLKEILTLGKIVKKGEINRKKIELHLNAGLECTANQWFICQELECLNANKHIIIFTKSTLE